MRHPVLLLLTVGCLQAVLVALANISAGVGMSMLTVAMLSTLGSGAVIWVLSRWRRPIVPVRGSIAFFVGAGTVSYALPNALVFATAEKVGPAYAALLYAFVPGLTYLIALIAGLERRSPLRLIGLLLGLAGAVLVVTARFGIATPAESFWLVTSLFAPVSVATGNVLRSRFWPPGASVTDIAPGLLLSAGGVLLVVAVLVPGADMTWPDRWDMPLALLAVASVFYVAYFYLQQAAGAVYLSQIGYVAATAGLVIGATFFAEPIAPVVLAGLALVVLGIFLVRPRPGEIG